MSVALYRKWVCDNCGHTEDHDATNVTPSGWIGLRDNQRAPIGSLDHHAWRASLLCQGCWSAVEDALDAVVNPDAYPKVGNES